MRIGVIAAQPILEFVAARIRQRPVDPRRGYRRGLAKISYHPLLAAGPARVKRIEIGVRFPERGPVAIVQPRIAIVIGLVGRVPASRQAITPGGPHRAPRMIATGPVALTVRSIAPTAFAGPVPGLDPQFGAQI